MTKTTVVWLTASFLLLKNIQDASAFSPITGLSRSTSNGVRFQSKSDTRPLTKLGYRALNQDDEDTTMLKTADRLPVGYDMRKALAEQGPKTAMNTPLIKALLLNQSLILGLATAVTYGLLFFTAGGFSGPISNMQEFVHWTGGTFSEMDLLTSVAVGALGGALPMLAFSNAVESSDKSEFANINFSTIIMVMTLFGRRKAPPQDLLPPKLRGLPVTTTKSQDVAFQSLALASTTGFCEESVFRQLVPGLIAYYTGGNNFLLPYLGQAFLFGLGHVQPGKTGIMENGIVLGVQIVNGLVLGGLYAATGGNIVPCIVAHTLYDFVVFFKTWMDANNQIEYAESMYEEPFSPDVQRQIKQVLAAGKANPTTEQLKSVKRTFFIFDTDKNKTLSLSEVRKGLAYLAIEKAATPPPQAAVDDLFQKVVQAKPDNRNRLEYPDFLRLITLANQKTMEQRKRRQQAMMRV